MNRDEVEYAFVVGAGFLKDVGSEVGSIQANSMWGPYEFNVGFPLVAELATLCFPDRDPTTCDSIEAWFHEALESGNYAPATRLYDELMKATYYAVPRLIRSNGAARSSSYQRFFEKFPRSHFITYNYDPFVEASLLRMGRWFPHDG
ncbi:MAG: hypothetical protein IH987_15210, partial [Planctomycetes bacterium]|nr:hypothetical protein [Planctomycetota bacterium]